MWPFRASYPALHAEELAKLDKSFDFIIIGGGTAGCCLAARLSEDRSASVLVIERGIVGDDWMSRVPLLSANMYRDGSPTAIFPLLPMKHANNRVVEAVIGEGLGGGSRINSSVYTRGMGDYNLWRDMGHPAWSYQELEPYFAKSENTLSHSASRFRGKSGPWFNQTFPEPQFESVRNVPQAVRSMGIPIVSDLNSPASPATCSAPLDVTVDTSMRRVSTMDAFLPAQDVLQSPNLTICVETIVTRIQFDNAGDKPRAVGVYYEETDLKRSSRRFYVQANKEIILCAGAVASPQLLMLSGVGPSQHLSEFGIKLIKNLPGVGSYLKDHPGLPLMYEVPMDDSITGLRASPLRAMVELLRYLIYGSGLFSRAFLDWTIFVQSSRLNSNMEFTEDDSSNLDTAVPDIEIMPVPHRAIDGNYTEYDKIGVFSLLTCLLKPKSYGTVRLASADPHDRAAVDLGVLSNPEDFVVFRTAIRLAIKLADRIRSQGYPLKPLLLPDSDDVNDMDAFIRENIRTGYHYSSTCRMAPENDPSPGVVDDDLKVHGIQGLRICDASIFPEIVSTHTMAPVVVVAEKCADMIKETWKQVV